MSPIPCPRTLITSLNLSYDFFMFILKIVSTVLGIYFQRLGIDRPGLVPRQLTNVNLGSLLKVSKSKPRVPRLFVHFIPPVNASRSQVISYLSKDLFGWTLDIRSYNPGTSNYVSREHEPRLIWPCLIGIGSSALIYFSYNFCTKNFYYFFPFCFKIYNIFFKKDSKISFGFRGVRVSKCQYKG